MTDQMQNPAWHKTLSLKNFTVFSDCSFEFSPGINAFVGENGTGKTHAMKAMYALQLALSRSDEASLLSIFRDLFQTKKVVDLVRFGAPSNKTQIRGYYGESAWGIDIGPDTLYSEGLPLDKSFARPVFIPAIDMMGHSKGFAEAYAEVRLDFDLTCLDIVTLLRLERRSDTSSSLAMDTLAQFLGGEIEKDDEGRYYLVTDRGRIAMPLVAEGVRKIATLVQVYRNGWLPPGATLFWDEPEVNLNPVLMDEIVGALLALARNGVQVFLATHSYVILKELDLQANRSDDIRYFGFQKNPDGTKVNATRALSQLQPNPILDQYNSLYDRELTRSTGRSRQK